MLGYLLSDHSLCAPSMKSLFASSPGLKIGVGARVFFESKSNPNISWALDLQHVEGAVDEDGDEEEPEDRYVVYQVEDSQVTAMWMADDVNSYATEKELELADIEDSLAYSKVEAIVNKAGLTGEPVVPTFNNYHNIEAW